MKSRGMMELEPNDVLRALSRDGVRTVAEVTARIDWTGDTRNENCRRASVRTMLYALEEQGLVTVNTSARNHRRGAFLFARV